MNGAILGLHPVTAMARDPNVCLAFYTRVLGLRLVKRTVNFDDPFTYHLYFGDRVGSPGSLLTHFPDPDARSGVHGTPEIFETVLSVRRGSLGRWRTRLERHGVEQRTVRFGEEERVVFCDPDGTALAIREGAEFGAELVQSEDAVPVLGRVAIRVADPGTTAEFLVRTLGFGLLGDADDRLVLGVGDESAPPTLGIVRDRGHTRARFGAGVVHHVAWRTPDDSSQSFVRRTLLGAGAAVSEPKDRSYFRSIYARIPGGVIFEFATDGPGFAVDEPTERLGRSLCLPREHEAKRSQIENSLVPLEDVGA